MKTVRVILPAGVRQGRVTNRNQRDKTPDVRISAPPDVTIEWISESPNNTRGSQVVDKDGNLFRLADGE